MKRTNPKDADDPGWARISWDEAYATMGEKYNEIIARYGGPSIMMMSGTSRCWCMGAYGTFPALFQSPNRVTPLSGVQGPAPFWHAHAVGLCFQLAGTVDQPEVMVRWGSGTELSNYDDSCRMTVDTAMHAQKFITVDPRLTNLGKESDIWQPLYPQTDGALALSWMHVIIEKNLFDELFVKKNGIDAPFLVVEDRNPRPARWGRSSGDSSRL